MENYRGKSEINKNKSDDDPAVDLELKLGQSVYEKKTQEEAVNSSRPGIHGHSYNMGNYSMLGGHGMNPNFGYSIPSSAFWPNAVSSANYLVYQGPVLPNVQTHSRKRPNPDDGKVCRACQSSTTPLWRKGPDGPQTLCNACGLRHIRTVRKGGE